MAIDSTRESKWDPVLEGPYTVSQVHRGGNYTLKGLDGVDMPRRRTLDMLRPIPSLETAPTEGAARSNSATPITGLEDNIELDEHYEVEDIVGHEWSPVHKQHRFYVKWRGYPTSQNTWVQQKDFDDHAIIKRYWKKTNTSTKARMASMGLIQEDAGRAMTKLGQELLAETSATTGSAIKTEVREGTRKGGTEGKSTPSIQTKKGARKPPVKSIKKDKKRPEVKKDDKSPVTPAEEETSEDDAPLTRKKKDKSR